MKTTKLISCLFLISSFYVNAIPLKKEKNNELCIEYTKSDVTCFGKTDGKIELDICGGKAPYIVVWDNGCYSMVMNNLRNGEYSVKVCDARGKTAIQYIIIETPPQLQLSFNSSTKTFVDAVGGEMNAKIIGGSPWEIENTSYYFSKINNQSFLENSENLPDGEYTFSVEDAHGCILTKPVLIDFTLSTMKNVTSETTIKSDLQVIKMTIIDHSLCSVVGGLEMVD